MFPPSSSMMDRIRAESELRELEHEAAFNAHFQPMKRGWLSKLFSLRKVQGNKQAASAYRPANTENICCEALYQPALK